MLLELLPIAPAVAAALLGCAGLHKAIRTAD